MTKRIFSILLAMLVLLTSLCGCSGSDENPSIDEEPTDTINTNVIDWSYADGDYLEKDNNRLLTLEGKYDDIMPYYTVDFLNQETGNTILHLENCGDISEDGVMKIEVSETDIVYLDVTKDDDGVSCIVVTGQYEGKDFEGNGTYYIAAG